jgi:benzoylformate decarboxylase
MTTIFSNPGSTEVSFLVDLPDDIGFVLALHEGSVVGIASGYAIGSREPAFVLLHTTAGLGNAVGAIATARVNHAPLVIVVGQQDRRHLALEPFLAGRLEGLAGDYPLDVLSPVLAQDVPSAIERAAHTARIGQGPVIVIVPMDDWDAAADPDARAAADIVIRPSSTPTDLGTLPELLDASENPVIVAGSGNDTEAGWAALVGLAERIDAPVWQEAFGSRVGFPQNHQLYQGRLPADRTRLHQVLAGHDLVVVVGAGALRQYPYVDGSLVPRGTRIAVITADESEARRSPADLSIVAEPAAVIDVLLLQLSPRKRDVPGRILPDASVLAGGPFRAAQVFAHLDEAFGPDAIIVEESPSTRPLLEDTIPTRRSLGFLSAAMGGLGFAMPAAIGLRMALPERPVIAVVGDGSSLYSIQSLWTAAHHGVGVLFVVMANGRYAVMDRLAERQDGKGPWPAFPEISVGGLARSLGCPVRTVDDAESLRQALSSLDLSKGPLLLEVVVPVEETFAP